MAVHTACFRFCAKPEIDRVAGSLRQRAVSPGAPEDGTPYGLVPVLRETGNRSCLRGAGAGEASAQDSLEAAGTPYGQQAVRGRGLRRLGAPQQALLPAGSPLRTSRWRRVEAESAVLQPPKGGERAVAQRLA